MEIDYDKMSVNGRYLTQSLFYEFKHMTGSEYTPYTIKDRDYKGSLSVYKIYMTCNSEYEAAIKLFNSWKHWEHFLQVKWFSNEVEKWRKEMEIRDAAVGKATLINQARDGNAAAARALLEISNKRKAGRPSKDEVEAEKKKQAAIDNKVSSLLDRMK